MSINESIMAISWNRNMEILGSILPEMLSGRKFVDVTLAAEGRRIKCHRLILAAYSSYFSDLLEENPEQHPIIIFSTEIKFWMIEALVDYMYRGEISVQEDDLEDLIKCAETLKMQGFNRDILSQFMNQDNRDQGTEQERSIPHPETAAAAEPDQVLIDEFRTDVFDVQDTEIIYPIEDVFQENSPEETDFGQMNEGSPLMNRSAKIVLERVKPAHVGQKEPNQRKTLRNYRISGKINTENASMDCDDNENSSQKNMKFCEFNFGSPPKDFVIPCCKRSYDKKALWSALMSVKNGMSIRKASQKFMISQPTISQYMKKFGIKSTFMQGYPRK
ncbi:hypothetical protein DMENIID0001_094680 [Sergentomyia squamirostris]